VTASGLVFAKSDAILIASHCVTVRTPPAILFLVAALSAWGIDLGKAESALERYRSLVVSDFSSLPRSVASRLSGVRVTYLGTNGYLLETRQSSILIDPYFSRIGLAAIASNSPIQPDLARIHSGMGRLPKNIDAILVTHGHFDHLLDAPEIARRTGASIVAATTSCLLSQAAGASAAKTVPVRAGDSVYRGGARIHVLAAVHDRIFGVMPFPGVRVAAPGKAPRRPSDWVCGEPLAFLVEIGGKRIYVDSGGTLAALPPATGRPVDLAILGVSLPDSRKRVLPALRRLRPRYILPSHQDDFFRGLHDGFRFGPMTDFNAVLRSVKKYNSDSSQPARLILLDYFAPWTLN
jgi:L-ascorbate metabolism protein UlaG (beta-lactamase superfamily)